MCIYKKYNVFTYCRSVNIMHADQIRVQQRLNYILIISLFIYKNKIVLINSTMRTKNIFLRRLAGLYQNIFPYIDLIHSHAAK